MKRKRSLAYRIRRAAKDNARYWSDPEFRLRKVNYDRARNGRPLLSDLSEIATQGRRAP